MLKTTLDVHVIILPFAAHGYRFMDAQMFALSTPQLQTGDCAAKFQRVGA